MTQISFLDYNVSYTMGLLYRNESLYLSNKLSLILCVGKKDRGVVHVTSYKGFNLHLFLNWNLSWKIKGHKNSMKGLVTELHYPNLTHSFITLFCKNEWTCHFSKITFLLRSCSVVLSIDVPSLKCIGVKKKTHRT